VRAYAADLTQRSNLDALLQHLAYSNTQISVLVANAGGAVTRFTSYWDFSEAEEAAMQALNGTACYVLVKQLLPGMVQVGSRLCIGCSLCMGFSACAAFVLRCDTCWVHRAAALQGALW
jgi:short-subunit dehydrogenase